MRRPLFILFFLLVASAALKIILQWFFPLYFSHLIVYYGAEMAVDPFLLAATIQVESGFRPEAVSLKGAVGLMQIMPDTALWLGEKQGVDASYQELIKPENNIRLGSFYLKYLLEEFPTEEAALAAYNGGPNNVRRWLNEGIWDGSRRQINKIPFPETESYVRKVIAARHMFRCLYRRELQH